MPSRMGKRVLAPLHIGARQKASFPAKRRFPQRILTLLFVSVTFVLASGPVRGVPSASAGRSTPLPAASPTLQPAAPGPTPAPPPVIQPTDTPHLPAPAPAGTTMPSIPDTLISPPPSQRLTTNEAIDMALSHNPQIGAQRKTFEAAVYRMQIQYAGYYPTVTLNATQQHSESQNSVFVAGQATATSAVTNNTSSSVTITNKRDPSSIQLSASQTLIDFGQRRLNVLAAQQNVEAARQDLEKTKQDVTLTVRTAFFTAFVDQVLVDIKRQTVVQRQQHLLQAQGFYEAGVRAKNEVTKAQADLAQAQLDLVKAVGVLRTSWVNLNVAMGLPRNITYALVLDPTRDINTALDRERLLAVALAERPELRNLQARIRAQIYNLQEVYAGRYPTISANAGYGWAGAPSPLNQAWNIGVALNWNLFNGFLSHFQASEARALAESLLQQLEQQRQTVYQQVQNDYITFETSRAAIDSARVSLENAQENYRLAQERYQVGLGSNLEFIDAQVLLAQAQTDLATAQSDFRTARAQLEHDVGVFSVDALPVPAPPIPADKVPGSKMTLPSVP